ncbi:MAG: hypothetical protein Kow00124_19510 [Anaerolineae bacterium]
MKRLLLLVLMTMPLLAAAGCASQGAVEVGEPGPRPDAAAGEEYREDHPGHVAATGRPQLIEFFSYN